MLTLSHVLELGERCHLPDALCENAFFSYQKQATQKQQQYQNGRRRSRTPSNLWAAYYLYQEAKQQGFCLTLREICEACHVSEKSLWKLFRKEGASQLLKSFVSVTDLSVKYSRFLCLSPDEGRRIRTLLTQISARFQGFSPSTIACLAFYLVVGESSVKKQHTMKNIERETRIKATAATIITPSYKPDGKSPRKTPPTTCQRNERRRDGVRRLFFSEWARRPIAARKLAHLFSNSTTCLFRIKRLWTAENPR